MAARYWVGGSGTWDSTSTANWSTTFNGSPGASAPTTADTADFNNSSGGGNYTVTVDATAVALSTTLLNPIGGIVNLSLSGNATLCTAASTFTFTSGTITLNNNNLSVGIFSSSNSNTRSIAFGSGNIVLTSTTAATTVLAMAFTQSFTWTGTGGFSRNQAATATVRFGETAGGSVTTAPNLFVTAGASALTINTNAWLNNIDFTGSTCTVTANNLNIAGDLTLATGGTYTSFISSFRASGTVTSVSKTLGNTSVNGNGITVTLADAMVLNTGSTFTLTFGRLDLAGFTLSTGIFNSTGTNTRSIAFGSGNIVLTSTTAAAVVLGMGDASNFTRTGTGGFSRNQAATATLQFGTTGGSAANAPNLLVTAGASALTITGGVWLNNIDFTGSTCTVTAGLLNISGSLTLATGGTYTGLVPVFAGTGTVTPNGKTIGIVVVNTAGTVTLGGALTSSGTITFTAGTFTTSASNYTVTATQITVGGGTLTLNGSTVALSSATPFTYTSGTLNAGTSQINLSGTNLNTFAGGGQTYYNVSFTSNTSATTAGPTITGANTFNNLTVAPRTATIGIGSLTLNADQTINGTLTFAGNADAGYRMVVKSNTLGTTRTLTCAAVSLVDVDFQDITGAGAAAPFTGTRLGDGKGNSGITFPAAKTVYWNLVGGGNYASSVGWAASSGASPATANFPLAQDTAVFEATGLNSGATITVGSSYFIGTIDMSARTSNTMTLTSTNALLTIIGNWVNGTGVTPSSGGSGGYQFSGRGSQTITSAGRSFNYAININSPGGTVALQDALTNSGSITGLWTLTNGTLDLNGQTLRLSSASNGNFTTAAGTKNLTFNGGTLSLAASGTAVFNNAEPTGFTTTAGTGTGTISLTQNTFAKTFIGGGSTYNCTINQGGLGVLNITGSNTFSNITNTYSATGATSILFTAGTTSTFADWNANGEATRLLTIGSITAASHTLSKASGTVSASYLSISRSDATGGASWNAANSTDGGNNTGWSFGGTVYSNAFSDTATGTDTFSAVFAFLGSISETATATDALDTIATLNPTLDETATGTDTITPTYLAFPTVDEAATATDEVSTSFVYTAFTAEAVTATDEMVGTQNLLVQLAESVTASDSVLSFMVLASQVSESATATDTVGYGNFFLAVISELATATDEAAASATLNPAVSETAIGTDLISTIATLNLALEEAATATDSPAGTVAFPASIAETATATDAVQSVTIFVGAIDELATGTDAVAALVGFAAQILETTTATDVTLVAPSVYGAQVAEAVTALEALFPSGIFNVQFVDSATVLDAVIGAYLWTPVDDNQTPSWQNVNNTQSVTWTDVNDDQTPGWTPVIP
jgi:hypothetical protein